jgi:hypothetical protein
MKVKLQTVKHRSSGFCQNGIQQSHVGNSLVVEDDGICFQGVVSAGMLLQIPERFFDGIKSYIVVAYNDAIEIVRGWHVSLRLRETPKTKN